METMSIGAVARGAGVQPSTLRYYERIGLLPAPRRVGGQRRYDPAVLRQLAVIAAAQAAGFTLAEIKTLLTETPDVPLSARWQTLAARKRDELDARIARAEAMKDVLAEGARCRCRTLDDCALTAHYTPAPLP